LSASAVDSPNECKIISCACGVVRILKHITIHFVAMSRGCIGFPEFCEGPRHEEDEQICHCQLHVVTAIKFMDASGKLVRRL
jgi:hypothetical protein